MAEPRLIEAAGGVLHRLSGKGKRKVLVVHRKKWDDWTLPKGHLDTGETHLEAAQREVAEETGYVPRVGLDLGTVGYPVGKRPKAVRYWLMEPAGGTFSPTAEIADAEWLSVPKAHRRLSYAIDRNVLGWAATLLGSPQAARVHLLRHANAGRRATWRGADFARPLSTSGHAQARHLADALRRSPLSRLVSSPWVRCVETVVPLALELGLKVEGDERLGDEEAEGHADEILAEMAGQSVVVCSHGSGLRAILERARRDGAALEGPPDAAKGSVWVLDVRGGQVIGGRYEPPQP